MTTADAEVQIQQKFKFKSTIPWKINLETIWVFILPQKWGEIVKKKGGDC